MATRPRLRMKICDICSLIYSGDSCYRCASRTDVPKIAGWVALDDVHAFMVNRSRAGNKCAECGLLFTVDSGDRKRLAIIPNGHGVSMYMLCYQCGQVYEREGPKALPNVLKDCEEAVFMSPIATPPASHLVQ